MESNFEHNRDVCHSLAKATGTGVRLYKGEECLYYYSIYHLHPDPALPFLNQLLDPCHPAGVITTPLYQYYGYLSLDDGSRIIIGPSRIEMENSKLLDEQLFLLNISSDKKDEYSRILKSFPIISAERTAWLIDFLSKSLNKEPIAIDALFFNVKADDFKSKLKEDLASKNETLSNEAELTKDLKDKGYDFELISLSYITHGEVEQLNDLLNSMPSFMAGTLSEDGLRQIKDLDICGATVASRAAIKGGLDRAVAFHMSDLYIQKIEMLQDRRSLELLRNEMMVEFAKAVKDIRFGIHNQITNKGIFESCRDYISKNLYNSISVEEMADYLGYTRPYLSNSFKKETGITITKYVLQGKIFEAQRMLSCTDRSLADIADLFAFSSQSHFQNVFKEITGETPKTYRNHSR